MRLWSTHLTEFQKTKVTDAKGQLRQALSCSLGRYTLPEVVSVLLLSRLGDWHPDTQEKIPEVP